MMRVKVLMPLILLGITACAGSRVAAPPPPTAGVAAADIYVSAAFHELRVLGSVQSRSSR
jgi:hypothetical protein